MKVSERTIIAIIIAAAVCARIVSFGYLSSLSKSNPESLPYPIVAGDSVYYSALADNLLELHAYQKIPGEPLRGATPGYPVLLAATKAITGSMTPLVIVQIILGALAAALLYTMARSLVPRVYATPVALAYALDPMVVYVDSTLLTDGIFSSLFIFIVYMAFFQANTKSILRWGIIGLLLGAAIMIRPIAQFLIIVFPVMFLVREKMLRNVFSRLHLQSICTFLVACALIIVPWMARNEKFFGSFEISHLGPYDLLTNDVRGFLGWRALEETPDPLPAILVMRHFNDPIFETVDREISESLAKITPPGENPDSYQGKLAISYIMRDPFGYAYFHGVNTIPFFIGSSIATYGQTVRQIRDNTGFFAPASLSLLQKLKEIIRPQSASAFFKDVLSISPIALEILWWILVTLLALVGLILKRKNFAVLLCAVLVVYFAGLTGPMSASRYRIPAEPYLLMLAAVGVYEVLKKRGERGGTIVGKNNANRLDTITPQV